MSSAGSKTVRGKEHTHGRFSRRVFFLLCNSCYWCASEIGGRAVKSCPACSRRLEPLLITAGELLKFDYGQRRGADLGFGRI